MRVQPSADTSIEFVHNTAEPPSLVIHDGTTSLVFSPADFVGGLTEFVGGLTEAAEFAEELVQGASEVGIRLPPQARRTVRRPVRRRHPCSPRTGRPSPATGDRA